MKPITELTETCIYTSDFPACIAFYRDVLGLKLLRSGAGEFAGFDIGGRMLLIFDAAESSVQTALPAHGTTGAAHICFGIAAEDFDAWRDRLTSHGVSIEHEHSWARGGRSLYFRDPCGHCLEVATPGIWGSSTGW